MSIAPLAVDLNEMSSYFGSRDNCKELSELLTKCIYSPPQEF